MVEKLRSNLSEHVILQFKVLGPMHWRLVFSYNINKAVIVSHIFNYFSSGVGQRTGDITLFLVYLNMLQLFGLYDVKS
jgi:hypothetical protein